MTTAPARSLRYLVLGGGAVAAEFYLPAMATLGRVSDLYVADPSKEALERLNADHPSLETLTMGFESALDRTMDLGIDAAIIALPNALHEPAVARALDCGLDVLCEKPLALTEAACRQLVDRSERLNRILGVGMTLRFLPSVQAVRRAIDAGWIGELESVHIEDGSAFAWSSTSNTYGHRSNAGVLANVGVHSLDLAYYLFGRLTPVAYEDDWRGGVEVNASYRLQTTAGVPVSLKLSYTHRLRNEFTINGTRGSIRFTKDGSPAHFTSAERQLEATISPRPSFEYGEWPSTLVSAFCEEFADFDTAIVQRAQPRAPARDAVEIARLIDWAYAHQRRAAPLAPRAGGPGSKLPAGKVVVTGGTGFVGSHLIDALLQNGDREIVVPIRSLHNSANAWRFPARLEHVDLLDRASLRSVMTGARYVFHLAYGSGGPDASRVTIEGTQHVVEAAIEAGAECVVVLSTTAVFGDPGGTRSIDESFPYGNLEGEYEKSKAAAESWTLGRARNSPKTRLVVVAPACVYGPGGKTFVEMPARLLQEGRFCWLENGRGIVNYVHVRSLVDATLRAAGLPDLHGERFIACDGSATWHSYFGTLFGGAVAGLPSYTPAELRVLAAERHSSLRDVVRSIVRNAEMWSLVGANPHLAGTKAALRRITPSLYDRVKASKARGRVASTVKSDPRPVPPAFLADLFGTATSRLTSAKAERLLGWKPIPDLQPGLAECRAWLQEIGLINPTSRPTE